MDRIEAMRMLIAAVDAGSLSAAGRLLGVPLPTLSRRVAELEARLGAELLVRSPRGLAPTEAGAAYVAAARRVLEDLDEAERAAAGEWRRPRGELVVTAPVVFGRLHLLPAAVSFLDSYPEVDLRLALSDRNLGLADEHVDVALRIGALPDSGLRAIRVGAVHRAAIASPDFLRRHGTPEAPSRLAAMPCVAFDGIDPDRTWSFSAPGGGAIAVPIKRRLSVNTVEAAVDAAAAGVGVARALTYQCAAALAEGKVVRVLRAFEPAPLPVHLLHASRDPQPLKLRCFLDHVRPRLQRRLADVEGIGLDAGR